MMLIQGPSGETESDRLDHGLSTTKEKRFRFLLSRVLLKAYKASFAPVSSELSFALHSEVLQRFVGQTIRFDCSPMLNNQFSL